MEYMIYTEDGGLWIPPDRMLSLVGKSREIQSRLASAYDAFIQSQYKQGVGEFCNAMYSFDGHSFATPHLFVPMPWLPVLVPA